MHYQLCMLSLEHAPPTTHVTIAVKYACHLTRWTVVQIVYVTIRTYTKKIHTLMESCRLVHQQQPMLKVCCLKHQSRQKTPQLIKEGFIKVERVQDAADFLEWETKQGNTISTNRIDDAIIL